MILQPLRLELHPARPILEGRLIQTAREVCELKLIPDASNDTSIGIDFRILEQGDGATIQLIYEGTPKDEVRLAGVAEGQSSPEVVHRQTLQKLRLSSVLGGVVFVVILMIIIVVAFIGSIHGIALVAQKLGAKKADFDSVMGVLGGAFFILLLLSMGYALAHNYVTEPWEPTLSSPPESTPTGQH
jgi:hypothetical protein